MATKVVRFGCEVCEMSGYGTDVGLAGKKCSRRGCSEKATKWCSIEHNLAYCNKHFSFRTMRIGAMIWKKAVPEWSELDALLRKNQDMVCPYCSRSMTWGRELGAGRQMTLQHMDGGGYEFMCFSCNTKHGHTNMKDRNKFLKISENEKWCPTCKTIHPISNFYKNKTRRDGLDCICKECRKGLTLEAYLQERPSAKPYRPRKKSVIEIRDEGATRYNFDRQLRLV